MERQLIEALASLKGGKKKLRELLAEARERCEHTEQQVATWKERMEKASRAYELIEKLSAREEQQKENSIGE